MSGISNRFFVTALDDGTTLHGNLSVDGSLSQAWDGTGAVPNWGDGTIGTKDQPTIMLTLLSGATYIGTNPSSLNGYINSGYKWYYNNHGADAEIIFESTMTTLTWTEGVEPRSVTGYKSTDGKFLKNEASLNGVPVPCLRIIKNLASSDNVDLDTVSIKGQYNTGSGMLDFQASAQIRISRISSGGYLGVISFADGKSNITDQTQSITMTSVLYGSTGNNTVSCKSEWYLNGTLKKAKNADNTLTVTGTDIVDNAIVRCDFYVTNNGVDTLVATEYASIDDLQDPEMMYIQYASQNGNAASLRKGQTATFDIWIGKNNDPTVDTSFAYFQVKLLNGSGQVITASYQSSGIPDADGEGWRTLSVDNTTKKARIPIPYDVVDANGKNITGLIRASTSAFS